MSAIAGSSAISSGEGDRRGSRPVIRQTPPGPFLYADREQIAALEDSELVEQTRLGNTLCFDQLVVRYREKALRLVLSTLGSRPDVEDIIQDVFVKIYRSLDRFRGDASFSTYLYTVTINRCRDEMRRGRIRRFFSFDDWFARSPEEGPIGENGQTLEREEIVGAVRRAMARLPKDTSMLLHLREIEELSYRELAAIFDVEIGTIKSRLARAREKLRVELLPFMNDE